MTPAVSAAGLEKRYGARRALAELTFDVEVGEFFALIGPNGSGKSTFFRIASTLARPDAGRLLLYGADAAESPDLARRTIGVSFQSPALDATLTVRENLHLHARLQGLSAGAADLRVREEASALSFEDRLGDRVATLSGGTARRVEIARAMLHSPRLLLLDEPETGLDPRARRDLAGLLAALRGRGVTILLVTHFLETAIQADRIGLLDEGRLVALGRPEVLLAEEQGDVIVIEGEEDALQDIAGRAREAADGEAKVIGGKIHFSPRGPAAEILPRLYALAGVRSVAVRHATLEEVFLRRTGHSLLS